VRVAASVSVVLLAACGAAAPRPSPIAAALHSPAAIDLASYGAEVVSAEVALAAGDLDTAGARVAAIMAGSSDAHVRSGAMYVGARVLVARGARAIPLQLFLTIRNSDDDLALRPVAAPWIAYLTQIEPRLVPQWVEVAPGFEAEERASVEAMGADATDWLRAVDSIAGCHAPDASTRSCVAATGATPLAAESRVRVAAFALSHRDFDAARPLLEHALNDPAGTTTTRAVARTLLGRLLLARAADAAPHVYDSDAIRGEAAIALADAGLRTWAPLLDDPSLGPLVRFATAISERRLSRPHRISAALAPMSIDDPRTPADTVWLRAQASQLICDDLATARRRYQQELAAIPTRGAALRDAIAVLDAGAGRDVEELNAVLDLWPAANDPILAALATALTYDHVSTFAPHQLAWGGSEYSGEPFFEPHIDHGVAARLDHALLVRDELAAPMLSDSLAWLSTDITTMRSFDGLMLLDGARQVLGEALDRATRPDDMSSYTEDVDALFEMYEREPCVPALEGPS
jgi:hypothetical protein